MPLHQPLAILFTNICLAGRSGTEVMTAELALALARRGHAVTIYTPRIGPLAQEVMSRGVPVTDRISTLGVRPDIIHGHHNTALAVALARFPAVRCVFVCHDTATSYDAPILGARIGAYVAVDLACAQRLEVEGAPPALIHVVPNAVDLTRFACRGTWQAAPRNALAITKSRAPWLPAVRDACAGRGILLDEVGPAVHRVADDLADRMASRDIVFAWSRSACEAAATGAAVVLCDETGFGGLLTAAEAEEFPHSALGRRVLSGSVTAENVGRAIDAYDPADAARVAGIVRRKLSLDDIAAEYERIYRTVLAESPDSDGHAEFAGFLERIMPRHDLPSDLRVTGEAVNARMIRLDAWVGGTTAPNGFDCIGFDVAGLGPTMLGHGWSPPEDWGTWSQAQTATIDLPRALVLRWNGKLAVACRHYFPAAAPDDECRPVEIALGSRLLARWHFFGSEQRQPFAVREITIPASALEEAGSVLTLRFRLFGATRPSATGDSADQRLLGLALKSIGRSETDPSLRAAASRRGNPPCHRTAL